MRIIDLTHLIYPEMPVYPGTEGPILDRANTIEKDGFQEAKITMYSHTGTHIDAPAHMLKDGPFLDDFHVSQFIGEATILDFSEEGTQEITLENLKLYEKKIRNVEFLVLKTGWSRYWGEAKYFGAFPALTKEAAQWLTGFKLKGIGIDAISIDLMNTTSFAVHKTLMPENMIIIENLTNLDGVQEEYFVLSVLPLKNKQGDGSPVRAIAIER